MNPLLAGLLIGIAFGAILFASGLADPRRIVGMLRLQDLWLLRVLVTAIAVGIVGIALLSVLGAAHTSIKTLHVLAVAAGGRALRDRVRRHGLLSRDLARRGRRRAT